jgi:fructokinase
MANLYGAIEGGGSKFLCAVGTGPDNLCDEQRFETRDPESTLADVVAYFAPHRAALRAIGVSCFGPLELDPRRGAAFGSFLRTPKPGWSGFPLHARLSAELALPVALDTDVNGAALAEQRWGALAGADPAVYVTVGTGVGVGVVVHGRALHGLMHPELGHLPIAGAAHPGVCPFHGACVEGLASAPAIRARSGAEPERLDDADPVWPSVIDALARLLHAIVLAYSPERIVLGGGVLARAGLRRAVSLELVRALAGYVPREALEPSAIERYVVAPGLGARSGLLGGLWLAMQAAP